MEIKELPVRDVMNKKVPTVSPSTTLSQLIQLMRKSHLSFLPVVDEEKKLIGVVNYNDILQIFRPFSKSLGEIVKRMPFVENVDDEDLNLELSPEMGTLILVDDIINKNFIAVKETDTIKEARKLMRLHNIEMLPVIKEEILVGTISLLDIFVHIFKEHEIL
jgi:CBS domain-containing protein